MMTILLPLVAAGVLAVLPALGAHVTAGRWFFGVLFPYFALVVFLAGVT
ncbi:MAG: menaquinol oxidoreductase, partial [Armatimonadetes bacterium CG_4_9_14_3_um_filter_66_14]